jgi:hypothetical protein
LHHHPDGLFIGNSKYGLSFSFTTNQPGGPEFFNMVRYGRKGDAKFFSHSAHSQAVVRIQLAPTVARTYLLEDCHAILVGQSLEGRYDPSTIL